MSGGYRSNQHSAEEGGERQELSSSGSVFRCDAARYCCLQFLILFIISFLRSASALALKCTFAQRRRDVLPDMSDPPSDSRMFNQMLNVAGSQS